MAIAKQALPLQFAGGVETKIDAKQVAQTQLLNLENATFIKGTTLAKRNGYSALSQHVDGAGADYSSARGIAARDGELVLFTESTSYSYRDSANNWSDAGAVMSVIATDRPIARTGTHQTVPDIGSRNGVSAVAWEDSAGGVWASVIETASGRILLAPQQLDSLGTTPRCIEVGEVIHILWARATASCIYISVVNPASPSATLTTAILTNDLDSTNGVYDAEPTYAQKDVDSRPGLIAWARTGGGFRVGYIHPSGVLGSPITGLPSVATYSTDTVTGPIAVAFTTAADATNTSLRVAVVWCDTRPHYRIINAKTLTSSIETTVASSTTDTWIRCVACWGNTVNATTGELTLWWAAEIDKARDDQNSIEQGYIDVTIGPSSRTVLAGHGLVSRAFIDASDVYVAVAYGVQYFPYVAVIRISASIAPPVTVVAARVLPGSSTGLSTRKHVASVLAIGVTGSTYASRQHSIPLNYRIQLSSENGDQFGETGIRVSTLDFNNAASYQSAQLGRGLYLASACPQHYDGRRWAEADFHAAPDISTGATTLVVQGGAGAMAVGTYGYKFVYEEIDAMGELHQGAVSIEYNVTIAANKKVTVTLPCYRLTGKKMVRIGVFRSPVNQTGDPFAIPFYRVTSTDPTVSGDNGYVLNVANADAVSFTDNMTDAVLLTKEPLYTNGGILSNDPVPMSGAAIAGGKSRLYWIDQSDPNVVRYSQPIADDTAAEMPATLALRVDPYGGDIVGIGVMDDAVIVLKETAIYVFGGPGPDADGGRLSQNAFTPAQLVTSDVGCISPKSIAATPVGLIFQSQKGIMLIDRSRSVVSIGDPVYAYNAQTVTRATLLPDRHQIVLLTNSGKTILFDYERKQWSLYTNHEGLDALVLDNVYHYLRTDGRVFEETAGLYVDDNSHIPMKIETAWIKFTGYLQGWQKVIHAKFLGEYKSAHTLRIRYRIDYQAAYSAPIDQNVNSNYNPSLYGSGNYGDSYYGGVGGDSTVYQRSIHLNKRCQSISFEISDVEATDTYGAAFELSEMLLVGGVLGPDFKVGAARSS